MIRKIFFIFIQIFIFSCCFASEHRYILPIENSPLIGYKDAPVTIIEFIDYQ